MNKKIVWQYWANPFGDDSPEFVDEDDFKLDDNSPFDDDKDVKIRPVLVTPMGLMPIHPVQDFTKYFQFWVAHTNFDITPSIKDKLDEVVGVEILDVMTRYSFRVSIGKAFNSVDVKDAIHKVLGVVVPKKGNINPDNIRLDADTQQRVSLVQSSLKEKFSFWAIYVLPNGEIDVAGSNTKEEYDTHIDLYLQTQSMAGGIILQYE